MFQKQRGYVLVFLMSVAVVLCGLMFTSCNATGIGAGDLEVSLLEYQEKSILPSSALRSVNTISISGTGPNNAPLSTQYFRLGGKIAISGLSAGTWKITVIGYNGTETEHGTQLTSESEQTVIIKSGVTTSATFNLHYLTTGEGSAQVTVKWPSTNSSVASVTGTVKTGMETEPSATALSSSGSASLSFPKINIGNYDFDLVLTNTSGTTISLPMIDMVNIFNALSSTGTIDLMAEDVPFVATPVISVSEQPTGQQTEENYRTVSLFSSTPDATIYYTVLDTDETGEFDFGSKIEYTGPFDIVVPDTDTSITKYVRAIAVKNEYQDSLPASETVTVNGAGGTDIEVTKPTLISNVTVVRENSAAIMPAFAVTYSIQGNLSIKSFTWYVDGVEATDCDTDGNGNTFTYNGTLAAGQHQIMVKLGYIDEKDVQETVSGALRLNISDAVATPVISSESVTGGTLVTITCATKGASIYYTTDGTTPTNANTCYSSPFEIDETSIIKAIAIMTGAGDSAVATSNELLITALSAPTFSLTEGSYATGQTVEITCEDADIIYYTLDGTDPTEESQEYSSVLTIKETSTVKAMAVASGKANAPVAASTYTITYSVGETGPAGGTVFYVNPTAASDGWTYLEVAPSVETSTDWAMAASSTVVTVGDTEQAIGSGETNTNYMVKKADSGAAVVCAGKTTGDYQDWFLPSLEELKAFADLPEGTYWSSSEASTSNAWAVVKDTASVVSQSISKTQVHSIYAIRSFL